MQSMPRILKSWEGDMFILRSAIAAQLIKAQKAEKIEDIELIIRSEYGQDWGAMLEMLTGI